MAFILAFLLLAVLVIIYVSKTRKRRDDEPPLVPGHWLLGSAPDFSRDAVGFLLAAREAHGDVFTLRLLGEHVTVVMDPHFYEQIGRHRQLSFDPIQQQVNRNVFGCEIKDANTLLRETGLSVRGHNQTEAMQGFLARLEARAAELKLSLEAGKSEMKLRPLVVSTLFSAMFDSIFGSPVGQAEFNSTSVHENFEVFHEYFNFLWLGLPLWCFPKARRALENLQNMPSARSLLDRPDLSSYMKKAIEHMLAQNQTEAEIKGHNLVYLHVNYNTFRLAYWALYFLIECDEARISIMEELEATLATCPQNGCIELSEGLINGMPRLESFVLETCRLSSGVFIVRHVTDQFTVRLENGRSFSLRAGDKVAMFPPSVHKDPDIFVDPKDFKYDRFVEGKFYKSGRQLASPVMPFGTLCPGRKYALLQLKIFLVVVLLRFHVSLAGDKGAVGFDEVYSGHEILPPKGDADVTLSARDFHSTILFSSDR